ncbi:MAG TPA: SEC-C metal-binding domain-containing protein [Desulfomonilaceae bacterium]|nr:SEC-C metal-binding domain-containing protein [Desulfomonilaceae bacterium]
MKKIKSPWYGVTWIGIWTAALIWFLCSGLFNRTESIGLVVVWGVMVGATLFVLAKHFANRTRAPVRISAPPVSPALNGPCPCGSGKKYKRCCRA